MASPLLAIDDEPPANDKQLAFRLSIGVFSVESNERRFINWAHTLPLLASDWFSYLTIFNHWLPSQHNSLLMALSSFDFVWQLKAFYVDLLVPLESNIEKDTKVVQVISFQTFFIRNELVSIVLTNCLT